MKSSDSGFHQRPWWPWMICVLLAGVLTMTGIVLPKALAKDVTLTVDGHQVSIATMENTVEQLLKTYNIILNPTDKVEPSLHTALKDGMRIRVIRATAVRVSDAGHVTTIYTTASSIKDMFKEAGISIRTEDVVQPDIDQPIYPGLYVNITRAVPVTLIADGQKRVIYTTCGSVAQLLTDIGIYVGPKDKVSPDLNAAIESGMAVEIVRVNEAYEIEEEAIPYKTIIRDNNDMLYGQQKVVQAGQNGRLERKILVVYENGQAISRKVVAENIAVQPKNRIVERGTIRSFVTSRGEAIRYTKVLTMVASAYTAGYDGVDNTTSTGRKVQHGIVAVDPTVIPLGTRLYIEGYGFAVAADVGGAIKGNKIDLYMETISKARAFGRRIVKVYILD